MGVEIQGVGCVCHWVQCMLWRDSDVDHSTVNRRGRTWSLGRVWEIEVWCMCLWGQRLLRHDNHVGHCNMNRRRNWGRVWEIEVWGVCAFQNSVCWGVTMMWVTVLWTGGGTEEGCRKSRCVVCVPFRTVCVEVWQWRGSLWYEQDEKNMELRKGVVNRGVRCMCLSEQCVLRRDSDVGHSTVNRRRRTWSWRRVWEIEVRGVCAFQNSVCWGVTMTWVTQLWTGGEEPGAEEGRGWGHPGLYSAPSDWCGRWHPQHRHHAVSPQGNKIGSGAILKWFDLIDHLYTTQVCDYCVLVTCDDEWVTSFSNQPMSPVHFRFEINYHCSGGA